MPISDLMELRNGANAGKGAYGEGVRFINVLEVIKNPYLGADDIPGRIQLSKERVTGYLVRQGDVVFNRTSELADEVGLASVYDDDEPVVFGGFVIRGRIRRKLLAPFAGYGLRGPLVREQIIARGQGAIRANVSQTDLRNVLVPVPPEREQTAIAEALGEADSFLELLEQLIVKKRLIKQGAMQGLLTGASRLGSYGGEWNTRSLRSSATLKARIGWQGLTTAEYQEAGHARLVGGESFIEGRIDWAACPFVSRQRYAQDKNIQLKSKDVLVTKDGTVGKVAMVDSLPHPATLNSGVFVIRPTSDDLDPIFLSYLLQSRVFESFLSQLSAGSTISHLYQKDFIHFDFRVPPSIEEQVTVSRILQDMDAEIAALAEQRTKVEMMRRGMMQELLTGRIRLV